ncbi:MAG: amidohydrolase [Polyangiaceae bacterium]|nr:amidohydrolase [Polyangiaceae bacterium]
MSDFKIIDCDQHVIEAPDIWEKWMPAKFQDMAPKLVKDEDGGDAWQLGKHAEGLGLVAAMNQTPKTLKWTGTKYDEMHPGIYQPKGRLELMDQDGVHGAVFFPPQRTMIYFMFQEDKEFSFEAMKAYNNFISDFCKTAPTRLKAVWQMPATGIEDAIAEARRAKEAGAVGLGLATWPSGEFILSEADDKFWAVAEELNLPIQVHVGLTPPQYKTMRIGAKKGGPPQLVGFSTTMSRMPTLFAEFIFNGVFERFPKLKVVGGEVGSGWVPFFKQELDDRYRRNRYWCNVNLSMLPSDYYDRNCMVGLVSDQFGVQNCDAVGVDTMMWCSDFPHHITDWPHSRYLINSMSQGISAENKAKIFGGNAAKLYGFEL